MFQVAESIFRSRVSAVRCRVQVFSAGFRFGSRTRSLKPVPDTRRPKGLEPRMVAMGLLRKGEWLVPTGQMSVDTYGNPKPSEVKRIIGDIGGFLGGKRGGIRDTHNTKAKTKARRGFAYVWIRRKTGAGIYRKEGNGITAVYVVTGEPKYGKRFDFVGDVKAFARVRLADHAQRAIDQAIRRANRS